MLLRRGFGREIGGIRILESYGQEGIHRFEVNK